MRLTRFVIAVALLVSCSVSLFACDGSGSGGLNGVYTSVESDDLSLEFKSGGVVVASMAGEKGEPGTWTVEGEKIIVDFNGQKTTFIRDGDCIRDNQNFFGQLCKGGKKGAASNVSTRTPPATSGTWVATNEDGTFTIDFKSADAFTFSFAPVAGSQLGDKPMTQDGRIVIEGDVLYTTLGDSTPMVLKWVNNTYESSAFGPPMTFKRK